MLVIAIAATGFAPAMVGAAAAMAMILVPAIMLWIDRPPARVANHPPHGAPGSTRTAASWTRPRALRSVAFWSVAAPFALALMAQVGFLVHQIAFLEPALGRTAGSAVAVLTVTAIIGRLALGAFTLRLDLRNVTALSLPRARPARCWRCRRPTHAAVGCLRGVRPLSRKLISSGR